MTFKVKEDIISYITNKNFKAMKDKVIKKYQNLDGFMADKGTDALSRDDTSEAFARLISGVVKYNHQEMIAHLVDSGDESLLLNEKIGITVGDLVYDIGVAILLVLETLEIAIGGQIMEEWHQE